MQKLQGLLREANQLVEHVDAEISVPLIREGVLYEVTDKTLGMPQGVGLIQDLGRDYQNAQGIGNVIPQIHGLADVLSETQDAAGKIIAIQSQHQRTLYEMSQLCFDHMIHTFPHGTYVSRGGILRVQITEKAAVYQILFLIGHNCYAVSHEGPLSTIIDESAFGKQPFSQVPPKLMIRSPDSPGDYVSATYGNWKHMIESTHHNAPRPKTPMYRSRTADVFKDFRNMVEELLAA